MSEKLTAGLVLTTINDLSLLEGYLSNFRKYGHLEQVTVFVIPDKKTPNSIFEECEELGGQGLNVRCPTIEEQDQFLKSVNLEHLIPYNSDNRRNVGFLLALEEDVDFLISIDDDNFVIEGVDFFSEHSVVASGENNFKEINSSNGWFNICNMINFEPDQQVYPRGFPYHHRHEEDDLNRSKDEGKVKINEGLWLSDPDLDGMTWLNSPVIGKSFTGGSLVLGENTWSPINTQNTSLNSDLISSYYFIKMDYPLTGISIDRYGDIFSGYFVQKVAKHFGDRIRFGTPVADHRRNSHNFMKDAYNEFMCVRILEDLTKWLRDVQLDGKSYREAYRSLSFALEDAVEGFSGSIWSDDVRGYFHQVSYNMRKWVNACEEIKGID